MSDSSEKPWSNNPYAPQIPHSVYNEEKGSVVGSFIGTISYGITISLFCKCLVALFDPANRRMGRIKWPLLAHTVAMFSFVTVFTGMSLGLLSISFIDTRDFAGGKLLPPGPIGYQFSLTTNALTVVPSTFLFMNNWLADGLLLYRCYIIYTMNYWVIALPGLMYLASVSMGIAFLYQFSRPNSITQNSLSIAHFGTPFISISLALNLILTLMIVVRLTWHNKNIRDAMGASPGISGICKAVATILTESFALYAINFILYIRPYGTASIFQFLFWPILAETQVIAPFLITIRVAKHRALTSGDITSGGPGSIQFREWTVDNSTLSCEYPMSSMGAHRESHGESGAEDKTILGEAPR